MSLFSIFIFYIWLSKLWIPLWIPLIPFDLPLGWMDLFPTQLCARHFVRSFHGCTPTCWFCVARFLQVRLPALCICTFTTPTAHCCSLHCLHFTGCHMPHTCGWFCILRAPPYHTVHRHAACGLLLVCTIPAITLYCTFTRGSSGSAAHATPAILRVLPPYTARSHSHPSSVPPLRHSSLPLPSRYIRLHTGFGSYTFFGFGMPSLLSLTWRASLLLPLPTGAYY